ncbi:MAG: hypothetical protein HRU20_01500 [Pseudomonadales bacterium]|nr:hypothetical protein [Pseudomonadales bacterium]
MTYIVQKIGMLMLAVILGACSHVEMQSTTFFQETPSTGVAVHVIADDASKSSLSFQHYQSLFEIHLRDAGYRIVAAEDAELMVAISYGLEGVQTQVKSLPSSGVRTSVSIGRSSYGRHGAVGISAGTGSSSTSSTQQYVRFLNMEFIDAESWRQGAPQQVYQRHIRSKGKCADFNMVFEPMLFAMFAEFPGINGETTTLEVEASENC